MIRHSNLKKNKKIIDINHLPYPLFFYSKKMEDDTEIQPDEILIPLCTFRVFLSSIRFHLCLPLTP